MRPTLSEVLERRAVDRRDHSFLRMTGLDLTYGEFNAQANRVGHGLSELGIFAGQQVSIMLPNSLEFMQAWFGLSKIGAVEAPVNTAFRGPGLAHMLNLTASPYLIVDETYLEAIESIADTLTDLKLLIIRGDADAAAARFPQWEARPFEVLMSDRDDNPGVPLRASDLAMTLFTSGTTGRSKACLLSHNYPVRQGELMADNYRFTPDDVLYCSYPLFHVDAAVFTVAPAIIRGATAALGERFSVSRFWSEVRAFEATVFDFMGATLTMLWKQPEQPDDADNPVRLGWGVPMPEFADQFEERFALKLIENYGLTDAGVVIFHPYDEPRRPGSCGKAVHPYDVRIFSDEDEELPDGEVGEIVIRPLEPSLIMDGYYKMPEATVATMRNLWFHTGDLAYRDEDGFFFFVGRKKEVIRRRGENISAFEIEEIVSAHPTVLECAAIGIPSELTDEDVKLCVVLRPGMSLTPEKLIEFCSDKMAKFMLPRYVEFLDDLPKTPTQKIEKYRLKEAGVTPATWDRGPR